MTASDAQSVMSVLPVFLVPLVAGELLVALVTWASRRNQATTDEHVALALATPLPDGLHACPQPGCTALTEQAVTR